MSKWFKLAAACAGVCLVSPLALGQVVINEFSYDDEGTDDFEFVELFNPTAAPIDISSWVLSGRDPTGPNLSATIPAATILAPGAYYVVGNTAVTNVNQIVAANFFENDNETVELRDPAGALIDAALYEANLGTVFAPADVLAQIGKGVWGNQTMQQGAVVTASDPTLISWSRIRNGVDTNNNGRDFISRPRTPGANNTTGSVITQFTPIDVDALSPGTQVSGLTGSFRNPRVINPGDTSTLVGTLVLNPNVIPPSPQGGNAIIAWDPSGGGNTSVSNDWFNGNSFFDIFVYLDTSDIIIPGAESTSYGIGSTDTFNNFPDPDANLLGDVKTAAGHTGLAWIFNKNNAGNNKKLFLVDALDGGDSSPGVLFPNDWNIIATVDMSQVLSAWHRLSIAYDAATGAVTAMFDGQAFNFNTATGLAGEFYTGYRESLAGVPNTLRPPTFDIIPEPGTLSLLALAAPLALRRRRR